MMDVASLSRSAWAPPIRSTTLAKGLGGAGCSSLALSSSSWSRFAACFWAFLSVMPS